MDLFFERITTTSDLEQLKCWLEDEELQRMARMRDGPLTEEDFQDYVSTLSFMVYAEGVAIGYARIYPYADSTEGEIGVVIALPEYWRKGIGTEIGKRVIATCLVLGMRRIHWATSEYNLPSIRLAKKLGFKFEKLIPDVIHLKDGRYDALVYVLEIPDA